MKKASARLILLTIFVISLVTAFPAAAGTVTTIDFEDLNSGEILATQYPGLNFNGAPPYFYNPMTLDREELFDDDQFPAHSGTMIVDISGGPCRIDFATPVSRVGTYYNSPYANAYLKAYDINGVQIDIDEGIRTPNNALDYLQVSGSNIAYVIIGYNIINDHIDHMTFDDLEYETPDPILPEYPNIVLPMVAILGLMCIFQRRKE